MIITIINNIIVLKFKKKTSLLSWKTDQDGLGIIIIMIIITNAKIIVTLSQKNAAMAPFKIPQAKQSHGK